VEIQRPADWMRALDSGAGKSVMVWCLDSSIVGQKSSIKVQHAQEVTELTGRLRRGGSPEDGPLISLVVGNPQRTLCDRGR
jgi:hypothetical protein